MRPTLSRKTNLRVHILLRLWGILASICIFGTILIANAYPLSWVAVWPGTLSVLTIVVFLYLVSLRITALVEKLILAGRRMIGRPRRRSEGKLEASSPSLNESVDGLSHEVDELRRIAEELDWKMKLIPKRPARRELSPI
jgi:hypothetical protein